MEVDSKGRRLITVVRVLEYHGPEEWIRKTLEASRIPVQGEFRIDKMEETYIRSGLVNWNILDEAGEPNAPATPVIPIPPGSNSIQ